jgi:hypothetical protein
LAAAEDMSEEEVAMEILVGDLENNPVTLIAPTFGSEIDKEFLL